MERASPLTTDTTEFTHSGPAFKVLKLIFETKYDL